MNLSQNLSELTAKLHITPHFNNRQIIAKLIFPLSLKKKRQKYFWFICLKLLPCLRYQEYSLFPNFSCKTTPGPSFQKNKYTENKEKEVIPKRRITPENRLSCRQPSKNLLQGRLLFFRFFFPSRLIQQPLMRISFPFFFLQKKKKGKRRKSIEKPSACRRHSRRIPIYSGIFVLYPTCRDANLKGKEPGFSPYRIPFEQTNAIFYS